MLCSYTTEHYSQVKTKEYSDYMHLADMDSIVVSLEFNCELFLYCTVLVWIYVVGRGHCVFFVLCIWILLCASSVPNAVYACCVLFYDVLPLVSVFILFLPLEYKGFKFRSGC